MKKFIIYQINEEKENARNFLFTDLEMLEHLGLRKKLALDLYNKVYEGEMQDQEDLDDLFCKYNHGTLPYKGHSLSVSDVIEVDGKFYYCDSYFWQEIDFPAFLIKANDKVVAKAYTVGQLFEKVEAYEKSIGGRYKKETTWFKEKDAKVPGVSFTLYDVA